jgi:hemolysin activation/secretion protein
VQLSLRPAGGEQGDVIGELTVAYRRFSVLANIQNYNSRLLGRETGYVRAELYGLTGLADLTYLGLSSTADFEEQRIVQVGHIFGLDASGTTLGGRFTYAWSRPDLGALDFRTDTLIAGIDVARPLIRSLRGDVRVRGGFDYIDQTSTVRSGGTNVPLTKDRLRVAFAAVDAGYTRVRLDGSTAFTAAASAEVRQGVDLFGSSERGFASGVLTSRVDGSARAFVFRGGVSAVLGLGRIFSVAGQAQVQWANKPLLSYEEFSLGNLSIGRGYDPGSNSGDRAAGGRLELRAGLPPVVGLGAQLFGFYDYVRLRNLDINALERTRGFGSYGGGARVSLPGQLVLEVTYARPRDRLLLLDERRPRDRLLVSLTAQFRDRAR